MAEEGPAPVDINAVMRQHQQAAGGGGQANDANSIIDRALQLIFGKSLNGASKGFGEVNVGSSMSLNASSPFNVFSPKGGFLAKLADDMGIGQKGGAPIQGDASKGLTAPRIEAASSGSGGGSSGGGGTADFAAMTEGIKISAVTSTAAPIEPMPIDTHASRVGSGKKGGWGMSA